MDSKKMYAIETRPCVECKNHKRDMHGSFCSKLLMAVTQTMRVTYKIKEGTCFEERETLSEAQSAGG